ncbi:MAG: tRNA-specific adenosine deaminase [Verrucomicrobia bacterium GWF2_51_19]|nr:MAG: tRNA-specific adenosine deaminase [Verrucomicrobia bacterium GWF2_51_19]
MESSELIKEAYKEAQIGLAEGGLPIGSVLFRNEKIIARGHNRRVQDDDPLEHAEINCLRNAGRMNSYQDCILVSTLMPCYLCAGAIVQFKIPEVIVGESANFEGAEAFLRANGVKLTNLNDSLCTELMATFIKEQPLLWNEDIGVPPA